MNTSNKGQNRADVLIANALDMIARTSLSQEKFAERLNAEIWKDSPARALERGYPNLKDMESQPIEAYGRSYSAWSKRVERWLNREVELVVWIEDAFINSLDEPYHTRAINEIASNLGFTVVKSVSPSLFSFYDAVGHLSANFGDASKVIGKILEDGAVDINDRPELEKLIVLTRALESCAATLNSQAASNIKSFKKAQ